MHYGQTVRGGDGDGGGGGRAQRSWCAMLDRMRVTLRDLGSAHVPHLACSRKMGLVGHSGDFLEHPLSHPGAGAHRAVLVGVNYSRLAGSMALRGRQSDVHRMYEAITNGGFDDDDGTRILVDDGHATGQPSRRNILRALAWLVQGAVPGDSLLFYFSGRAEVPVRTQDGSREWDEGGHAMSKRPERGGDGNTRREFTSRGSDSAWDAAKNCGDGRKVRGGTDGRIGASVGGCGDDGESAICPEDVDVAGVITRGELRRALLGTVPAGARLTVVLDCPGRGGAGSVRLPYTFSPSGPHATPVMAENCGAELPMLMAAAARVVAELDFIFGGTGGGGGGISLVDNPQLSTTGPIGGGGGGGSGKHHETSAGGTVVADVRLEVRVETDQNKPGRRGEMADLEQEGSVTDTLHPTPGPPGEAPAPAKCCCVIM